MNRFEYGGLEPPEEGTDICGKLRALLREFRDQEWFDQNEEFLSDPEYLMEELAICARSHPASPSIKVFRQQLEQRLRLLIVSDDFEQEMAKYYSEWNSLGLIMNLSPLSHDRLCDVVVKGLKILSDEELLNLALSLNAIGGIKQMWEEGNENIQFGPYWKAAFLEANPDFQLLDEAFDEAFDKHREELKRLFPDKHSNN